MGNVKVQWCGRNMLARVFFSLLRRLQVDTSRQNYRHQKRFIHDKGSTRVEVTFRPQIGELLLQEFEC